ncbi:MAG TPA: succinate dehydrogenase cytochrome b subunit [Planctomycetota bacterium]|nr:succinate dehydrogenase cytochrome b subunit [Planctomycetota bacterium]
MSRVRTLLRTAVGLKFVVAVTGLVLFAWVALHMLGNLKTFLGREEIDAYAAGLKTMGAPFVPHGFALWTVRIVLFACVVLHVGGALVLYARNRAARPVPYAQYVATESTFAARFMVVSGFLVLVYVVLHILHLTTGTILPRAFEEGRVYDNLSRSFRMGAVAVFYVGAVAVLALHLYHGVWSLFQTLGLDNPDRNRRIRAFAAVSAIGLFVGFAAVPLAFLTGVIR